MACGTVHAGVEYLQRLDLYTREKPFQLYTPVDKDAADQRITNLEFEEHQQEFVDIRGRTDDFTLDSHGFQVRHEPSRLDLHSLPDRDVIEAQYYDEIRSILGKLEGGCDQVYIFDHRVRSSAAPKPTEMDMNDLNACLRPSPTVHVDQSVRAVIHRVQMHLPNDAPRLLQGRVRIINVWRPIGNPVEDYPLACLDAKTVADRDLVECDHVRRRFKGANLYSQYAPGHKWYYMGSQTPEEVLLIKMFDSDPTVPARRTPHASFRHPTASPASKPRMSIEVRALVFNYPPDQRSQQAAAG